MTWFSSEGRSVPPKTSAQRDNGQSQPAVTGKTAPAKRAPPAKTNPLAVGQCHDLAQLREHAMEMAGILGRIAQGKAEGVEKELPGKSGVIDGLNVLAQIVTRVIDKERQCSGLSDPQTAAHPDEHGIERRIANELDRIAARNGAASGAGTDRTGT